GCDSGRRPPGAGVELWRLAVALQDARLMPGPGLDLGSNAPQQLLRLRRLQRPGEEVALRQVDPEAAEEVALEGCLDPFGHDVLIQLVRHGADGLHYGTGARDIRRTGGRPRKLCIDAEAS